MDNTQKNTQKNTQIADANGIDEASAIKIKSLAMVHTRTVVGVNALPVVVEVHLANGLPAFSTVGLPETAVRESKDRVRGAIINSGFEFPAKRITVNLSPADIPKTGSRFDLPIAIGILVASGQLQNVRLQNYEMIGELALDGQLRKIAGVLPSALACGLSQTRFDSRNSSNKDKLKNQTEEGLGGKTNIIKRALIVPSGNASEAALAEQTHSYNAAHLLNVCRHLVGQESMDECKRDANLINQKNYPDINEVKGQQHAKRALEIAAAGNHSLLMIGPPGTGKSMLASRLPGLLPELNIDDALQTAALESVANGEFDITKWRQRPFRNPHHCASSVALVGGGSQPKPGEISLAHKGILFLDELTEFSRSALEQLREPLETGCINIARAAQSVKYPADFLLVAACNPCKCGFLGDGTDRCRCSAASIESYRHKLSGPILDRIDMHVHLARVDLKTLQQVDNRGETSNTIKKRVSLIRQTQERRQGKLNSELSSKELEQYCQVSEPVAVFLQTVCDKLNMSARAYHRILKLARTIADIQGQANIDKAHVAEAVGLRSLDRR